MPDELDVIVVAKALGGRGEHDVGSVESDAGTGTSVALHEREQSPVARPQVEHPPRVRRDVVEEDALALGSARELVGTSEVTRDVFRIRPFAWRHASMMAARRRRQPPGSLSATFSVSGAAAPRPLGRCDGHCPWSVFANVRSEDRRRRPEALEGAVDAQEELP